MGQLPDIETPTTPERLIRFELASDFQQRSGFREDLQPGDGKPFRIIGGYAFKKPNWLKCGFSNCKTVHGSGYVIRNANGLETNIGHCCGKTMFQADWHIMFDQFETQRKVQAQRDVLARVLASRESSLKQAKAALEAIGPAEDTVKKLMAAIKDYGPVKRAFQEVVKAHGSLVYYRMLTSEEREMARGQLSARETKGNIDGTNAATVNASELARKLRFQVIVPLTELMPEELQLLPERQLELRLIDFGKMADIVQQAELYAEDSAKLAKPLNWHKFEIFCEASKVKMSPQGYRALRRLAGTA